MGFCLHNKLHTRAGMLCAVTHDSTRMRIQMMWGQEVGDKKQRGNNTQVIAKPRFSWIFN